MKLVSLRNLIIVTIFYLTFFNTNLTFATPTESRLMRFPAISEKAIVFSYAGDLYTVAIDGGVARKLTSHKGYEMFARFSPDGSQLAFTAQYDGNTEVYLMPSEGGNPKRLTYSATIDRDEVGDRMGPNNIVMNWTPDGKYITYRSRQKSFNDFKGILNLVSTEGGMSKEIPLSFAGFASWSPDGKKFAFNRNFREFRTWKHYQGGMADDIWVFDTISKKTEKIINDPHQDIIPMWSGDEIFFLSDREHTMNLFSYNLKTKQTEKLTQFDNYDIKFPSLGGHYIVFENGGYIYKFDIKSRKYDKVQIYVEDDNTWSRSEFKDASKYIRSCDLSPNGERIVLSARGDIYSLPAKTGITRNLTRTSGAHEREAKWSPDGKWIAWVSDASGEYEIYMQKQDGSEPAIQLTDKGDTYKYSIAWSPDSKRIAWHDRMFRLQYVNIKTKEITLVVQSKYGNIDEYSWSPDSRYMVYSDVSDNHVNIVCLYDVDKKSIKILTNEWFDSFNPVFSNDGKYIVFLSNRDFTPAYSQIEWNYTVYNMTRVYLILLNNDTPSPFAPENNEISQSADTSKKDKPGKKNSQTEIDFNGIENRIVVLPIKASTYKSVLCIDGMVYYTEVTSNDNIFKVYDLKKKEETELGRKMQYVVSGNNKKMLVRDGNQIGVIDMPSSHITLKETADLSNMKVWVDYNAEWRQIYDESWRQMRDFFYDPNMHGMDWKAMHDKYAKLVPYVRHRDDLTYIIGELMSELNSSHCYVNSGERPRADRIPVGQLGATITRHLSGYFRIDNILEGAAWSKDLRSPLKEIGLNVHVGDFILAVDGQPANLVDDFGELLQYKSDKTVELTVNSKPSPEGSRKILVNTIRDVSSLYYYKWVQENIKKVSDATNGEVGYLHIPDMGTEGLGEFVKYFYPQLTKKVLIIDDRGNAGGNVSPMIIERLNRQLIRARIQRNTPLPVTVPVEIHNGPKILLIDQYSASDGDLFAYAFKKLKLGTIVGKRTWGGVISIAGTLPFIDGAELRKPESGTYSVDDGKWIVEGHGVEPDVDIDNDPYLEYTGIDSQLDNAIEIAKEQLKNYKPIPEPPAYPDKSK